MCFSEGKRLSGFLEAGLILKLSFLFPCVSYIWPYVWLNGHTYTTSWKLKRLIPKREFSQRRWWKEALQSAKVIKLTWDDETIFLVFLVTTKQVRWTKHKLGILKHITRFSWKLRWKMRRNCFLVALLVYLYASIQHNIIRCSHSQMIMKMTRLLYSL